VIAMKAPVIMYLSVEHMGALKGRAAALGVPYSALADFLLSLALARVTPETLRAWMASRAGHLPPKEGRILNALRRLTTSETYRFDVSSVADAAGLPYREAYRALCALEGRGEVVGARSEALDRWNRPAESWWRLATRDEEAAHAERELFGRGRET
jgi:hypothetical protein